MKTILITIFFIFLQIFKIHSQTKFLNANIIDQLPLYNPNFEPPSGSITQGLLKKDLINGLPVLSSENNSKFNEQGGIFDPNLFQYFYKANENATSQGYNYPIPDIQLPLTFDNITLHYIYNNQTFYPIDLKGFDIDESNRNYTGENGDYHNFHFTMKISTRFNYKGNETITLTSDDDIWMFVNGKLELDIGGIHSATTGTLKFNTLGLNDTQLYTIDIFYAQRKTPGSIFKIDSNFDLTCEFLDYCGVCSGDGSTCCKPNTTCNDNNLCTIDECPSFNTIIKNGTFISDYCKHTLIKNPYSNDRKCQYQCNPKSGIFEKTSCSSDEPSKGNQNVILNYFTLLFIITTIIITVF